MNSSIFHTKRRFRYGFHCDHLWYNLGHLSVVGEKGSNSNRCQYSSRFRRCYKVLALDTLAGMPCPDHSIRVKVVKDHNVLRVSYESHTGYVGFTFLARGTYAIDTVGCCMDRLQSCRVGCNTTCLLWHRIVQPTPTSQYHTTEFKTDLSSPSRICILSV